MPILRLVAPDSLVLRTPTPRMTDRLTRADHRVIGDMKMTLGAIPDAIAIAGPQVGVRMRVFVVRSNPEIDVIIDPTITWTSAMDEGDVILGPNNEPIPRIASLWERCLSFPGEEFLVTRPHIVTIRFRNEKGVGRKASYQGWPARVVLHEIAHLDGLVVRDRAQATRPVPENDQNQTGSF